MIENKRNKGAFRFQRFAVEQDRCAMKVGTDGILLGAWVPSVGVTSWLDVGTGTGLIGLMLAQRAPESRGVLVEIDEQAAGQAEENVARSPFHARITVEHESIQTYAERISQRFDLIVSNPPFFTGGVISEQEGRANVRHTLRLSHGDLLRGVQRLLAEDGSFCLVLPWLEGLRFVELAEEYQLYPHRLAKVRPHPEKSPNRLLLLLKRSACESPTEEAFSIYASAGEGASRSERFAMLTADFFLP